ncbi:MAG: hypothetical protein K6L75_03635 [Cellvibrionaceae bacterium]
MSPLLSIQAGKKAFNHIQKNGLSPTDISSIFGASGAAKWLGIYGLDKAIFSEWLPSDVALQKRLTSTIQNNIQENKRIDLFGTSVGAWKLAAAAQKNAEQALDNFAQAYIDQHYGNSGTHADVQRETDIIIRKFLTDSAIAEILSSDMFNFHCGAVKCKGLITSEKNILLLAGLASSVIRNAINSDLLSSQYQRIIFTDSRSPTPIAKDSKFSNTLINLDNNNLITALSASGSIPYVMKGIDNIPNTQNGMYRDGGLLDYHPIPSRLWSDDGFILYPHFYSHLIPNWFDKPYKKRRAAAKELDNVILISPSESFIKKLPFNRLPDRNDFKRFFNRDAERQKVWTECKKLSELLGEEFLSIADKNQFAERTTEIK